MSILASLRLIRLGYRVPMLAVAFHVTIMLLLLVAGWTSVHLGWDSPIQIPTMRRLTVPLR